MIRHILHLTFLLLSLHFQYSYLLSEFIVYLFQLFESDRFMRPIVNHLLISQEIYSELLLCLMFFVLKLFQFALYYYQIGFYHFSLGSPLFLFSLGGFKLLLILFIYCVKSFNPPPQLISISFCTFQLSQQVIP